MKPRRHRLTCQPLEDRAVPAATLSASLFGDLTLIRGVPDGALSIKAVADNEIQVSDDDNSLNAKLPAEGTILIQLFRRPGTAGEGTIDINLDENTLSGDVLLDLGRGDRNADPDANAVTVRNGTLLGDLTVVRGDGRESITLGSETKAGQAVEVFGDVRVIANRRGVGSSGGDGLTVGVNSEVRGDLNAVFVETVTVGPGSARVRGDLTVTNPTSSTLTVDIAGQIDSDLAVTGSRNDDTFMLSGEVGGGVAVNLAGGDDLFDFAPTSEIGGVVTLRSPGFGDNSVTFATDNGGDTLNLDVIFGDGDDTVDFAGATVTVAGTLDGGPPATDNSLLGDGNVTYDPSRQDVVSNFS